MTSSALRDRFAFQGDALDGGDARVLRGAIYEVEELATGVERTLKLWRKTGTGLDTDLRQLWLHEMRQLQRLMAYSGARRLIVDVLELVEDDDHFGVVLERVGQPLETRRRAATRQHWLKNLTAPRSRALFWRNIRRLGEALGIVHGQGLVHGSISTMTVMTEGADEPDFLLGGFEWSLRVSVDGIAGPRLGAAAEAQRAERYSFAEDWRALGMLIAECLGLVVLPSGDVLTREGNDAMSLTVTERLLVRRLVMPARLEALEAQSIVRAIDDIVSTIAKSVSLRTGAFILMFAEQSGVGGVAHTNMGGAFDVDDWPRVLEWVRADLRAGARLLVPRRPAAAQARMHLVTGNAVYALHPFRDEGGSAWDIAVCDHVRPRGERLDVYDYDDHGLDQPIVAVRGTRSAREERGRRGADVLDWGAFVRDEPAPHTNAVDRVRKALLLVQCVEAVIKSLEILPVRIANREETDAGTTLLLRATPASQNVRDELAKKMGVADTADTLRRLFEDDDRESDRRWRLGQATSLGSSASRDAVVTFIDVAQHGTGYLFETDGDVPDARVHFLRPDGDGGTEQVIRRRLRHIGALDTRVDLAETLDNPWLQRRSSREVLDESDEHFNQLDGPKREALRLLWSTLPTFFVVGPPGVGKTRLATEVVRRRFKHEASTRMLVCAQGHDALEHLQQQMKATLFEEGMRDVLVVRSPTPERHKTTEDEVPRVVERCLRQLKESALCADAPGPLADRVRELHTASERSREDPGQADRFERIGLSALASLVLDGANIVISTANSADVERLGEDRSQFDWVVVEEAAKATGPELVGPMMLSGRHLLIGDHHQLPPFDSDRLAKVLADQATVREAVVAAEHRIGGLLTESEVDDLNELRDDPESLKSTAGLALRLLQPFRTFVEDDERRRGDGARPIAATLTEQRRMDPAIARIVSDAFYNRELTTEPGRAAAARAASSPIAQRSPATCWVSCRPRRRAARRGPERQPRRAWRSSRGATSVARRPPRRSHARPLARPFPPRASLVRSRPVAVRIPVH